MPPFRHAVTEWEPRSGSGHSVMQLLGERSHCSSQRTTHGLADDDSSVHAREALLCHGEMRCVHNVGVNVYEQRGFEPDHPKIASISSHLLQLASIP